ncbi:MAG: 4,5-DOPA dioxygenase extradiol, partial [Thermoleophilia bacterium]|nr:4,5-DOPA dioxygenase extradiol [Thermoleophilia bacterium]
MTARMPALFIGHGSPMNGIEDNTYSSAWKQLGAALPRPDAVLCVSAHWLTRGAFVHTAE